MITQSNTHYTRFTDFLSRLRSNPCPSRGIFPIGKYRIHGKLVNKGG